MDVTSLIGPIVLLLVGAAVGFLPSFLLDWYRRKHELSTRWDVPLFSLCSSFAESSRTLMHLTQRRARVAAADLAAYDARIDDAHARMRAQSEQLRLVGSPSVQRCAALVVHHAYSVRLVGEGKPENHPEYGAEPVQRLVDSLTDFYRAARAQLGVKDPDEIFRPGLPTGSQ